MTSPRRSTRVSNEAKQRENVIDLTSPSPRKSSSRPKRDDAREHTRQSAPFITPSSPDEIAQQLDDTVDDLVQCLQNVSADGAVDMQHLNNIAQKLKGMTQDLKSKFSTTSPKEKMEDDSARYNSEECSNDGVYDYSYVSSFSSCSSSDSDNEFSDDEEEKPPAHKKEEKAAQKKYSSSSFDSSNSEEDKAPAKKANVESSTKEGYNTPTLSSESDDSSSDFYESFYSCGGNKTAKGNKSSNDVHNGCSYKPKSFRDYDSSSSSLSLDSSGSEEKR